MHPLLRKILAATHLTRQGKLAEATAAIQAALSPATQAGAHTTGVDDEIIEVDAVEVPATAPSRATRALARSSAPGTALASEIVDLPQPVTDLSPAHADDEDADVGVDAPPAAPARFLASSFTGSAGTRAFKLFIPGGGDGEALPLVVMLHGCTQDPDDFAAGTRMNAIAQEQGFLVLYPAQSERANPQRCWNWFSPHHQRRGGGEPALLAGMTRHILQTQPVDRDRVYVAGMSAGGAMAAILAREYPDLFAAAGVHSGVVAGAARDVVSALTVMRSGPTRAPVAASRRKPAAPLIVFHGDGDRTVAIANADAVLATAIAGRRAVATTSQGMAATGERAFRRTVWRRADDRDAPSVAEHWVVHGSAHAWSGGDASGSYTDPAGPDASREMLRFFAEHPRTAAATTASAAEPEEAAP